MSKFIRSGYLEDAMNPRELPRIVRELKRGILEDGVQFNAIAFRGMSGALVAPMLALTMKKGLVVCRKSSEMSHAPEVEGHLEGGSYIIVDDFVSSGSTVRKIVKAINKWWRNDLVSTYRPKDLGPVPKFICEKVFCYERSGDSGGVADPLGDGRMIPVWAQRSFNASTSTGLRLPLTWARSGFDSSNEIVSAAEGRRSGLVKFSPVTT